ncbi:MAG TPA: S1 RNA-binding domain-containing protein, partial [Kiritimatiellia bacterium]|nr:S1 RNA-binding domain-containing protein [Kiritimatiellia bacterium]
MAIRKPTATAPKTGPMYDAMAAALDQTMNQFTAGSIIKGTISGIKGNEVFVDIGYKSEGVVPANEFEDATLIKAGDVIDVLLEQLESDSGMVVLSKSRADDKLRWDAVLAKYTEGGVVTGTIRSKVRGGLIVSVDGVDAFLPGSQVDVTPVHDPDPYLGTTCEFKVIKISNERRNIIVSRRELIEERMADKKRELLGTIEKGQQRHGRVKNITDFGAFVDL